jgi:hypothetical protein
MVAPPALSWTLRQTLHSASSQLHVTLQVLLQGSRLHSTGSKSSHNRLHWQLTLAVMVNPAGQLMLRLLCVCLQVDGLAAIAAALGCNSQLTSLSLAGSGITGSCLAAMAGAGLAAAAALATLDISIPDSKVSSLGLRMQRVWFIAQQLFHTNQLLNTRRPLLAANLPLVKIASSTYAPVVLCRSTACCCADSVPVLPTCNCRLQVLQCAPPMAGWMQQQVMACASLAVQPPWQT